LHQRLEREEGRMASIVEREENAYTLGVQAGLWGIRSRIGWRLSH
jgi:hypothetical protein